MDITCPQCKTEYEFEDAKVTEAGVTVKCTSCGFMFKVRRKAVLETEPIAQPPRPPSQELGLPAAPSAASGSKLWMIRTAGGEVYTFKELTTLQQWIVERKVARDDHISRSGETWKRLGDIVELASFFQVVDAAMAAAAMAPPARRAQGSSGVHPAPGIQRPPRASSQPAPVAQLAADGGGHHHRADMTGPATPPPMQPASRTLEPGSIGIVPEEADEPAFAASGSQFQALGQSAAWEEGGGRLSGRHATADLVDELPRRGTGKAVAIVIACVAVLGLVGAGVAFRDKLKGLFGGGGGDAADEAYQAGRRLFLQDDEESLKQAEAQLARAPQDQALVRAARAEVHTTWAQHLREEAEILDRRARLAAAARGKGGAVDPQSLRLKATTLREDANQKLILAEVHAKKGLDLAPEKGEVKRAMADYLRVHGGSSQQVLPFLTDARKRLPDDAETIYVEAAFWLAQNNLGRAEEMLKDALTKTKARFGQTLLRAALQLALVQLRAGRFADTRAQVDAMLQANGKHRLARELLDLVDAEERAAVSRAPGDPDAGARVASKPDAKAARPPGGGAPGGGTPPAIPENYEALVKQGNALAEKGRTMQALKMFERALKQNPAGVDAMNGLGFCYVDQARFAAAIALFKKALTIQPTNGEALIGMAEANKVQGNHAKALDYYRAYLQAQPGGSRAALARRNVADLERKVGVAPAPTPSPTPTPAPEPKVAPEPAPAPEPKKEDKSTP